MTVQVLCFLNCLAGVSCPGKAGECIEVLKILSLQWSDGNYKEFHSLCSDE